MIYNKDLKIYTSSLLVSNIRNSNLIWTERLHDDWKRVKKLTSQPAKVERDSWII